MRFRLPILFLCILVLTIPTTLGPAVHAYPLNSFMPLVSQVNHNMTIRVILVGINGVDSQQLIWNLEPVISPAIQSNHSPTGLQDLTYGSSFSVKYDIVSASSIAKVELTQFLRNAASTKYVPDSLQQTGYWSSTSDSSSYTVIPADQTEEWLNSHIAELGGIPDNGYSLVVANVSEISSLHHYYEKTYVDADVASTRATDYNHLWPLEDWMFSWGGHHSFYYLDLSGGDPKFDYSGIGHIPIQDFGTRYYSGEAVSYNMTQSSLTEYVASYVAEATRNLLLPSYVYAPTYSTSYKIAIHIFDDTGKISDSNVADYLSISTVKNAFTKLIPYATWDVSLTTHQLSDDPGLAAVVSKSVLFSRDALGTYDNLPVHINYYDYLPIYTYLQNHLSQYVTSTNGIVTLPTFEFIFKSSGRFAQTWEESIGGRSVGDLDSSKGTFSGLALGDMVLIGLSERSLFAFGYGLTHDTIHENGHQLGLMHPHSYGSTEDYVSSPMSYATYPYEFSQFDIDAIQRAHADYFLATVQHVLTVSNSREFLSKDAQTLLSQAMPSYQSALADYSTKKYSGAVGNLQATTKSLGDAFDSEATTIQSLTSDLNDQLSAAKQMKEAGNLAVAFQLLLEASKSASAEVQARNSLKFGLGIGVAVGVAVGIIVAVFMLRRKPAAINRAHRTCPTCGFSNRLTAKYCVKDGTRLK